MPWANMMTGIVAGGAALICTGRNWGGLRLERCVSVDAQTPPLIGVANGTSCSRNAGFRPMARFQLRKPTFESPITNQLAMDKSFHVQPRSPRVTDLKDDLNASVLRPRSNLILVKWDRIYLPVLSRVPAIRHRPHRSPRIRVRQINFPPMNHA